MLNIVIPAKDPVGAKSRLSAVLSPGQRTELAMALFRQTLEFFTGLPGSLHILVVTDSVAMSDIAREFRADVLFEEEARGETDAVNKATAWSMENGYTSQLVVPADMAGLDRGELKGLLDAERAHPSLILCPATDDDGTNAILSTPPDVVPFRFGELSFPEYCRRAEERNVRCEVRRLKSLVLDLDTPKDLEAFLAANSDTYVHWLLRSWNVPAK